MRLKYTDSPAPRFDLGLFLICFPFLLFELLSVFGSSTFSVWWKTSPSLGRWIHPGASLFGAIWGHLTSDRFFLPSIYRVVDVWGSLVTFETQMVSVKLQDKRHIAAGIRQLQACVVLQVFFILLPLNIPWTVAADFSLFRLCRRKERSRGPMKGSVFGYSCPGCGTHEQVRDSWQIIACYTCFSGKHRAQFCRTISLDVPCGVTTSPFSRLLVGHVPGLWRHLCSGVRMCTRSK